MSDEPRVDAAPRVQARAGALDAEGLAAALHDTTNALTVILGWLERARLAAGSETEVVDAIERATAHASWARQSMRRAIGVEISEPSPEPLATVVERTLADLGHHASEAGVRLCFRAGIEEAAPAVPAPTAVWQVLTNLLLNAVAFTPRGGAVEITATRDGEDAVVLRVSDQGPGIEPHRRATLFAAGESTRPGGAGLGLKHAHALAASHGGALTLAPEGPGACFVLRWPSVPGREQATPSKGPGVPGREQAAPSKGPGATGRPGLDGLEVIVLEDDAAVVELLELSLTARGAHVTVVATPETLTGELDRRRFDVLLVDLSPLCSQPGLDDAVTGLGRVVAYGRARSPGLTVVAISGSITEEPHPEVLWLRKPFTPAELTEAIHRERSGTRGGA